MQLQWNNVNVRKTKESGQRAHETTNNRTSPLLPQPGQDRN
ncbi:hypothetical protein ANO14919_025630 [Xylariales sp. No.14919]|nr:hypothetical protein ANO14919_025630 [Xylariales sp. No.14919]